MPVIESPLTFGGTKNAGLTTATTASITPTANRLVLAAIHSEPSGTPVQPTASGCSLTWVVVRSFIFVGGARLTVFRALGTPTSGTVIFDFGVQVQLYTAWSIAEFGNVDTSGTNGSGAIVQSAQASGVSTTPSVTLAAFGSANNATYGAVASFPAGITPGSGFTEIHDATNSPGTDISCETEWKDTNDTTVDATSPGNNWGIIGIEIKFAAPPLTVGLATETDTAFSISVGNGATAVTVGLAAETDTAFSITAAHEVLLGLAVETDTALPISEFVAPLPRAITQPRERFGCGEYSAYIGSRGGGQLNLEIAWTSISITKVVNGAGSVRLNIPQTATSGAPCCEVVAKSEPWRDEVVIYRDNELAFAGPLKIVGGSDSPNCFAEDLYAWMKARFIANDLHFDADIADIFKGVFEAAMAADTSPNIDISTRNTGIRAVRDYPGKSLQPAESALSELASTGLDFTMIGRKLVAGGLEVFLENPPLLLHDQGVVSAEPIKDGTNFANDVAILAATLESGGIPVNGRATLGQSVYGLVQKVFTHLTIRDEDSADANALARVKALQPVAQTLRVVLSPDAPFEYADLIPGKRMDVRLAEAAGCMEVDEIMRVVQVTSDVDATNGERVTVDLQPLGLTTEMTSA